MSDVALGRADDIARQVTDNLGGNGLFGVEFFIEVRVCVILKCYEYSNMRLHSQGDTVYFSELSPRPHDTGMVTVVSQNISEFALHVRAILGLAVPTTELRGPSASAVMMMTLCIITKHSWL